MRARRGAVASTSAVSRSVTVGSRASAVRYEGRMIDAASARLAQNLVALADRIAARGR